MGGIALTHFRDSLSTTGIKGENPWNNRKEKPFRHPSVNLVS